MKPKPTSLFKVQILHLQGWGDLKYNVEGTDRYQTETFESMRAAKAEAKDFCEFTGDTYRVVPAGTPEDWSPYCD